MAVLTGLKKNILAFLKLKLDGDGHNLKAFLTLSPVFAFLLSYLTGLEEVFPSQLSDPTQNMPNCSNYACQCSLDPIPCQKQEPHSVSLQAWIDHILT